MSTSIITINGHNLDTGCYIGGHWGQYGPGRLLVLADDILGTTFYDDTVAETAGTDDEKCDSGLPFSELVGWSADEAESALNDATPDGYVWHWFDGEFFLSPMCDDEESCDDGSCAHWY